MAKTASKTIYVLNGPNLNLLGTREPETYGPPPWPTSKSSAARPASVYGLDVEFRQSNHEGELVDWIHEARRQEGRRHRHQPGGYTHTSIAILDALIGGAACPTVEVHISNVHAREELPPSLIHRQGRQGPLICGFGIDGYALAIAGLAAMIGATAKA